MQPEAKGQLSELEIGLCAQMAQQMSALQDAMKDPTVQQQMAEMQSAMQNKGLQEKMATLKASPLLYGMRTLLLQAIRCRHYSCAVGCLHQTDWQGW